MVSRHYLPIKFNRRIETIILELRLALILKSMYEKAFAELSNTPTISGIADNGSHFNGLNVNIKMLPLMFKYPLITNKSTAGPLIADRFSRYGVFKASAVQIPLETLVFR